MASKRAPRTPKATTRPKAKQRPLATESVKPGRFESFDTLEELQQLQRDLPTDSTEPNQRREVDIAADLARWFSLAADLLANPSLPADIRRDLTRKVCDVYMGRRLDETSHRRRQILLLVAEAADRGDDDVWLSDFRSQYPDDGAALLVAPLQKAALAWSDNTPGRKRDGGKYALVAEAIAPTSFACPLGDDDEPNPAVLEKLWREMKRGQK